MTVVVKPAKKASRPAVTPVRKTPAYVCRYCGGWWAQKDGVHCPVCWGRKIPNLKYAKRTRT